MIFNCKNCGKCCGPIPVTRVELFKVKRELKKKTSEEIERLRTQNRKPMTCPLWDVENRRCSVYDSRPEICRMYGFYEGMECINNKGFSVGSREEGRKRLEGAYGLDQPIGVLGIDINWSELTPSK